MPDMSMCSNRQCPKFLECYRAQATPHPYWQSYSDYNLERDRCFDSIKNYRPKNAPPKKEQT